MCSPHGEAEHADTGLTDSLTRRRCKICGSEAKDAGIKAGRFKRRDFHLFSCHNCGFTFIDDPWTDFSEIYSEAYYRGQGADPLVDYLFELISPNRTIRQYEWSGLLEVIRQSRSVNGNTRWLDFGCGNGGLVRYVKEHANCSIQGFEEGWIAGKARSFGIPILSREELSGLEGSFDIVTAIEVLEHVPDPIVELKRIRSLLKPGGLFFFTTGNAAPYANRIREWSYVVPEVHISFYEPSTIAFALEQAGFQATWPAYPPGFDQVIRFKILKVLRVRETAWWEKVLPWKVIAFLARTRLQLPGHPMGIAE